MSDLPLSIAQHFHERTKYSAESVANSTYQPDWANPPIPFKEYKIGTSYDLKPHLGGKPDPGAAAHPFWQRLSRFLFCSYGLTLKMMTQAGTPIYLRSAPSAGGLYPAELYVISRGTVLLPAGLYHYQPQTHSLLQFWEDQVWTALQESCFWHPNLHEVQLAIVVTATFSALLGATKTVPTAEFFWTRGICWAIWS
ncbi:MAG: hypothetical protein HC881_22155 [Leptolyngbyaceae cyanobacterium SL_7_1]|nr:hypothetical protein [Leptolyngbyaceae cyanobacterium SL_7_1]